MENEIEELFKVVEDLQNEILSLIEENKKLITINEDLQDEVDSLWMMMDEITKSDLENFILEEAQLNEILEIKTNEKPTKLEGKTKKEFVQKQKLWCLFSLIIWNKFLY